MGVAKRPYPGCTPGKWLVFKRFFSGAAKAYMGAQSFPDEALSAIFNDMLILKHYSGLFLQFATPLSMSTHAIMKVPSAGCPRNVKRFAVSVSMSSFDLDDGRAVSSGVCTEQDSHSLVRVGDQWSYAICGRSSYDRHRCLG